MQERLRLKEYRKMLIDAVNTDGIDFCLTSLMEECAELIVEVNHYRRGRVNLSKVIEEMADVCLMSDMVRVGLEKEIGFYDIIKKKSDIIGKRIAFKKVKKKNLKC